MITQVILGLVCLVGTVGIGAHFFLGPELQEKMGEIQEVLMAYVVSLTYLLFAILVGILALARWTDSVGFGTVSIFMAAIGLGRIIFLSFTHSNYLKGIAK